MTAEHRSIMQLEKDNKRLALSTRILLGIVIFLAVMLAVAIMAGGFDSYDAPLDPSWMIDPNLARTGASVTRQQEVWDPISETFGQVGQATTDSTNAIGESAQTGLDLYMSYIHSFWTGATVLMVIIAISITIGLSLNVVEENYLIAGVLAVVLSGLSLLGFVGAYFQVVSGMFLPFLLASGIFAFFILEGHGKSGFFSYMYGILPALVVAGWLYPDIATLGGYADLTWYAEVIAGWGWTGA